MINWFERTLLYLEESYGLIDELKDLSPIEKNSRLKLIQLCTSIAEGYSHEVEGMPDDCEVPWGDDDDLTSQFVKSSQFMFLPESKRIKCVEVTQKIIESGIQEFVTEDVCSISGLSVIITFSILIQGYHADIFDLSYDKNEIPHFRVCKL